MPSPTPQPSPEDRDGRTALSVAGVAHRYGNREALRDVSFEVAGGESFGLLGPNGGGKTTLFRIASTLLAPTRGTVQVYGRDVVRDAAAVRRDIGVMFQSPALDGRLKVVENLRSALDYLIYKLACFDSKGIVDKTQFVIVDSEENFQSNKWHLNGLSGEHIAAIERLQPYRGCNWTQLIRDISNPDKHEHLTAIKHPIVVSIDSGNTDRILAGQDVGVNDYASIQIAFSNGPPVIEGLEQLISDVAHTLDAFEPEFK